MEGKEEGEQEQPVQGEKDDPVDEKKVIENGGEQVKHCQRHNGPRVLSPQLQ